MKPDFWLSRWKENRLGFHMEEPNPMLVKHLGALGLKRGHRVLVPLCGKTLDIGWLLSQGFLVAGAELSELAVRQLFAGLGVKPQISEAGKLACWAADGLEVFVGDFLKLKAEHLGEVDAVYDRAALVALPAPMRERYAAHLAAVAPDAPQLLLCFEYDQSLLEGPPFSVDADEVRRLYAPRCRIELLERFDMPDGLKGKCPAVESVWLLRGA